MTSPDDADTIFEAWRLEADRDGQADPESVIRANPALADELRLRFDAVRMLDGEFAEGRDHRPPERIGSYRIVHELGRGGMGVVYEAVQESMDRPVALKVLFPSVAPAGHAVRRFRQEARIAGSLKHTNIVAVHDLGQEAGLWYCAMELVDGPPLSRVIEQVVSHTGGGRGERPPSGTPSTLTGEASGGSSHFRRVARMFAEVADALGVAHEAGVLHRDVKPSNLLLDKAGHLRLVDFGLARLETDQAHLTRTGDVVGTPLYMSPEHFRGRDVGPRSDVYSLGATLYEVLTLRPPHDPKDATLLAAEVVTKDPPRPRSVEPRVPRDLETVVLKALEKDPARRYTTAAAFADDLRAVAAGDAIRAKRPGPLARAWRTSRRHPARITAVVALLGLIAFAGLLWVRTGTERDSERARAYDRLLLRHVYDRRQETIPPGHSVEDPDLWRRATATLDEAIQVDPDRPEAHAYRACFHAGSWEQRSEDLERARERGLPDRTYHVLRACGLAAFERAAEAEREERIASTLPRVASQWFNEDLLWASAFEVQGRWASVVDRCTQALSRLPAADRYRTPAFDRRSRAKERMGDYLGALEDLAATQSEGTPPWPIRQARLAHLWRLVQKPERAEVQFGEALETAASTGSRDDWEALCDYLRSSAEWQWLDRAAAIAMSTYPSAARFAGERSAALAALGRNAEAAELASAGLTIDSACAFCREQRGRAMANQGRHKAALEDFRASGSVALQMAELYSLGRPGDAVALARSETVAHPESHQAWCDLARFLLATNSSDQEALSAVDRALRYGSGCATSHTTRSQVLLRRGQHQEALDAVDRAVAIDPRLPWAHLTRFVCLHVPHRLPEALTSIDRAVELAPLEADFHYNRGLLLYELGQFEEGISACDRALVLKPEVVETKQLRAKVRICAGQADLALKDAELGLASPGPGYARWRVLRHEALVATGDLRGALAACDVPDSDPQASRWQLARAQLLSWQGRFDEALEFLHRRMSAHPDESRTAWVAAGVLVWAGRPEEALAMAKSIPQLEGPWKTAADESVCWLCLMAGKETEARALAIRSMAASGPNQPSASAWMLALVGRKPEARASLAKEMPPRGYDEAYQRASVHALLGDRDECVRWLGHAADWGYRRSVRAVEDPEFQGMKGDPRYLGLMKRILLP